MNARTVMSADDISRAITRISHEILESNHGSHNLLLLGIPTRGATLAARIAKTINRVESGANVEHGSIDPTMYRDDLSGHPTRTLAGSSIPASGVEGMTVVLVDDVLYSGRTVRAALDAIIDFGRPQAVRLAVLIDRGHRELPIRADFVGKNLPSAKNERIFVQLSENDSQDRVVIE